MSSSPKATSAASRSSLEPSRSTASVTPSGVIIRNPGKFATPANSRDVTPEYKTKNTYAHIPFGRGESFSTHPSSRRHDARSLHPVTSTKSSATPVVRGRYGNDSDPNISASAIPIAGTAAAAAVVTSTSGVVSPSEGERTSKIRGRSWDTEGGRSSLPATYQGSVGKTESEVAAIGSTVGPQGEGSSAAAAAPLLAAGPPDDPEDEVHAGGVHDDEEPWTKRDEFVSKICWFFYKFRYWVVIFWLVVLAGCIYPALQVSKNTSDENNAPSGTAGAEAKDFEKKYFFSTSQQTTIVGLLETDPLSNWPSGPSIPTWPIVNQSTTYNNIVQAMDSTLGWDPKGIELAMLAIAPTSNVSQGFIDQPNMFLTNFPTTFFETVDVVSCSLSQVLGCNIFPEGTTAACVQEAVQDGQTWPSKVGIEQCAFQSGSPSVAMQKGLVLTANQQYQSDAAMLGITVLDGDELPSNVQTAPNNYGKDIKNWMDDFQSEIASQGYLTVPVENLTVQFVGGDVSNAITNEILHKDLLKMDVIVIPVTLFLLITSLKTWRRIIITLICLITTYFVANAFILIVAATTTYASAAPAVTMSLIIALSVDYSLFLLSRYSEERIREEAGYRCFKQHHYDARCPEGCDPGSWRCINRMWNSSGFIIIGSGCTSCLCFICLAAFPVSILSSVGLGALIAVLVMMIVNLTLQPAYLFAFPKFFGVRDFMFTVMLWVKKVVCGWKKKSYWETHLIFATSRLCSIISIIICLAALGVGVWGLSTFKVNTGTNLLIARGSVDDILDDLTDAGFAAGVTNPYNFMFYPQNPESLVVDSTGAAQFYNFVSTAGMDIDDASEVWERQNVDQDSFVNAPPMSIAKPRLYNYEANPITRWRTSNSTNGGVLPGLADCEEASQNTTTLEETGYCSRLEFLFSRYTSLTDENGTVLDLRNIQAPVDYAETFVGAIRYEITLGFSQITDDAGTYVSDLRDTIIPNALQAASNTNNEVFKDSIQGQCIQVSNGQSYCVVVSGGAVAWRDMIDKVYELLPIIFAVIIVVALFFIGVFYKSLFTTTRAIVTLATSICCAFAIIIGIWQHSWLCSDSSKAFCGSGGLGWLAIPMGFAIMLGLLLDYDVFFLGRVRESRLEGRDTRGAIVNGAGKQLRIICVAGLIMICAFAGLLLSSVPMLNQVGFFLVVGLAIDVFFIRCWVLPAFMAIFGDLSWWPGYVPPKTITMDYEKDKVDDDDDFHTVRDEYEYEYRYTTDASSEYSPPNVTVVDADQEDGHGYTAGHLPHSSQGSQPSPTSQ